MAPLSWHQQPIIHFVLAGAVLFVVEAAVRAGRAEDERQARTIDVSVETLAALRAGARRDLGRPPTRSEERALLDRFVREEVLYRRAVALGLDRTDAIVRRRLVQKMEFLSQHLDSIPEPTEEDLGRTLEADPNRYAQPVRVRLEHVFVSRRRHAAEVEPRARRLLERLLEQPAGAPPGMSGDPFMPSVGPSLLGEHELTRIFGASFAREAIALPVGVWAGPIASSYGLHLVRILDLSPARPARLEEIRDRVANDWRSAMRASAERAFEARLLDGYEVRIDREAAGRGGGT